MAEATGLETAASCVTVRRSNRLEFGPITPVFNSVREIFCQFGWLRGVGKLLKQQNFSLRRPGLNQRLFGREPKVTTDATDLHRNFQRRFC
jgi:hypothetical protein